MRKPFSKKFKFVHLGFYQPKNQEDYLAQVQIYTSTQVIWVLNQLET